MGEALCVFVVYLFNPHAFLSFRLSPILSYTHLTPELTIIYSIMFSKVYWCTRVLCISGTRGDVVAYGESHAMLFVCTLCGLCVLFCSSSPLPVSAFSSRMK